jgi:hypothetical protein
LWGAESEDRHGESASFARHLKTRGRDKPEIGQ